MSVMVAQDEHRGTLGVKVPDRSIEQRTNALRRANEIRIRRAQLKRDVTAGRVSALDVLLERPDWAATMKVFDLLCAVPKCGRVRLRTAFARAGVSPSKTIGGITEQAQTRLVKELWLLSPVAGSRL